jgi:hypothetical protein
MKSVTSSNSLPRSNSTPTTDFLCLALSRRTLEPCPGVARVARSTRDLSITLAAIIEKKAGFRSLGDERADATTAHGLLMQTGAGQLGRF